MYYTMDETDAVREALTDAEIPAADADAMCAKLRQYYLVSEVHQIMMGRPTRWVRRSGPFHLTRGGIAVDVRFAEGGTRIHILGMTRRVFQIAFDECVVFQKYTDDELMVQTARRLVAGIDAIDNDD
jgi:hypothetical protein